MLKEKEIEAAMGMKHTGGEDVWLLEKMCNNGEMAARWQTKLYSILMSASYHEEMREIIASGEKWEACGSGEVGKDML